MIKKEYEQLTFGDDFIFCKVLTNNKELCRELLELILGIKISKIRLAESQKTIDHTYDSKGIRLDVYVEGDHDTVYDVEMQTTVDKKELPKRTRYYQGMIDLNLIKSGKPYKSLKKSFIIFICLNDPFGEGLPVYTFTYRAKENPEIQLKDDTIKVVINADGSREGLSDDMCAFLNYLQRNIPSSDFTKLLEEDVRKAINHREWRVEYMTLEMIKQKEHELGLEIGLKQGREIGLKQGREEGRAEERKNTERERRRADALEARIKELESKAR